MYRTEYVLLALVVPTTLYQSTAHVPVLSIDLLASTETSSTCTVLDTSTRTSTCAVHVLHYLVELVLLLLPLLLLPW